MNTWPSAVAESAALAYDYEFREEGWADFMRILEGFEDQEPELGDRVGDHFLEEFEARALPWPRTLARHPKDDRVHIFREHLFGLRAFYYLRGELVRIVAMEHMREMPDKWRGRLLNLDESE